MSALPRVTPTPDRDPTGCPACAGPMLRVPRHLGDRLLSLVRPQWRYRCVSHTCGWEGCLNPPREGAGGAGRTANYAAGHDAAGARPDGSREPPPASLS